MATNTGRKYLQSILSMMVKYGGHDRSLEKVVILSGGNGNASATMKVEKEHLNRDGKLHPGMTSTIVDVVTSLALLTNTSSGSDVPPVGISVAIDISFLKAASEGEDILIKARTDKVGKRLAYLTIDIVNKSSGELIAKGAHTKYIGG